MQVDVLVRTKVLGDGDAVEVLADLAVVDRRDVEQKEEAHEQQQDGEQADPHEDNLLSPESRRNLRSQTTILSWHDQFRSNPNFD